jgi:hypothetical protein
MGTAIEISRASVISFSVATTKQSATDLLGSRGRVACTRTHAPRWGRSAASGFSIRRADRVEAETAAFGYLRECLFLRTAGPVGRNLWLSAACAM